MALLGPTGAGKTLTLAKLAARARLRGERVAWVTLDDVRLGARAEAQTWGEVLEVPVFAPADSTALQKVVAGLSDYDRLLIDTPGISRGADEPSVVFDWLGRLDVEVARIGVLSATSDANFLRSAWERMETRGAVSAILTHLDEIDDARPVLRACAELEIPLAWLSSGQRVAGDLEAVTDGTMAAWWAA